MVSVGIMWKEDELETINTGLFDVDAPILLESVWEVTSDRTSVSPWMTPVALVVVAAVVVVFVVTV